MASEDEYAAGENDRRQANIMRMGTVSEVDAAGGLVKVDLGDLVTDWVPWTTPRAGQDRVYTTPDVGEQVVMLTPGEPSQGVVIGSLFQNTSPPNGGDGKERRITFKDGSLVEFDRDGSVLNVQVNAAGSIRLNIGGTTLLLQNGQATLTTPLLVVDAPQSNFTGNVNIAGSLSVDGTSTVSGDMNVQGITSRGQNISNTHTHTGVQPGGGATGAVS